jgi:hypothetical protein
MADELRSVVTDLLAAVAAGGRTITYSELLDALDARDPHLRERAEVDLAPVLRAVSVAADESGRGLLSAVVVRASSGLPGGGFFALAADRGRDVTDRPAAWKRELSQVHRAHSGGG